MQKPGVYFAYPTSAIAGETTGGKSEVAVSIEVPQIWDGKTWQEVNPPLQKIMRLSLEKGAFDRTVDRCIQLGWDKKDFSSIRISNEVAEKGFEVECRHDTFKDSAGVDRTSERWDFPFAGSAAKPATSERISALNSRLAARTSTNPAAPDAVSTPAININVPAPPARPPTIDPHAAAPEVKTLGIGVQSIEPVKQVLIGGINCDVVVAVAPEGRFAIINAPGLVKLAEAAKASGEVITVHFIEDGRGKRVVNIVRPEAETPASAASDATY